MEMSQTNRKKINLQLAGLLLEYSKNGRLVDAKYIEKLLDIVINGRDLGNYIKNFKVVDAIESPSFQPEETQVAQYDKSGKILLVAPSKFENRKDLSDLSSFLLTNSLRTARLLHEIEHADQVRHIATRDDMESRILRLTETDELQLAKLIASRKITAKEATIYMAAKTKQEKDVHKRFYECAPQERMAEIKAWQQIVESLEVEEFKLPKELKYPEESMTAISMVHPYVEVSPTIKYLTELHEDLNQFDWYDSDETTALEKSQKGYTLEERLFYGLPVSKEEKSHYLHKKICI